MKKEYLVFDFHGIVLPWSNGLTSSRRSGAPCRAAVWYRSSGRASAGRPRLPGRSFPRIRSTISTSKTRPALRVWLSRSPRWQIFAGVWHIKSGKPVPNGWRVYGTCDEMACVAPDHIVCRSEVANGAMQRRTGALRGKTRRILASRATGRSRSKLTPELIAEIQSSPETGEQLAQRLHLSASTVSKARRGEARSFQGAGIFSGLFSANDHGRRRA